MRRTLVHALVLLTLSAGSFVAGQHLGPESDVPMETGNVVRHAQPVIVPAEAPWREAVERARSTARAGTMRAEALEVLNTADSTVALADGLRMLGWAGDTTDLGLIEAFVLTRDQELTPAALETAGRIGGPEGLALLHTYVEDTSPWVRQSALGALAQTGDPSALGPLTEALDSQTDYWVASRALSAYGGPSAARALANAFDTRSDFAVHDLGLALAKLTQQPVARDTLYRHATVGDQQHRQAALSALASANDPQIFEILEGIVRGGTPNDQNVAIQALGALSDDRAVPLLMDLAHEVPTHQIYGIMGALSNSPDPRGRGGLLDLLEKGPTHLAREAMNYVHPGEDEALSVLVWVTQNRERTLADAAAQRLYGHGWPAEVPMDVLEMAREDLYAGTSQQWRVSSAVQLLLRSGTRDDRLDVYAWISEAPASSRAQAAWALAEDKSRDADAMLFDLLEDASPAVRNAALQVLVNRGEGTRAVLEDILLEWLESDDTTLAYSHNIEHTLVQLDSEHAMQIMEARVVDGTDPRWRTSMDALLTGTPQQRERLVYLLDDIEEDTVRNEVFSRLLYDNVQLSTVVDKALATDDPHLTSLAASALARVGGNDAKRTLRELVDHSDLSVRSSALSSLVSLGGRSAEDAVLAALKDDELAMTAVTQLTTVGTPAATEALEDVAQSGSSPQLRQTALYQLAYNPGPNTFDLMSTAVRDKDETVRMAAITGLQTLGTHEAAEQIATLLDGDGADAQQAAQALRGMGGPMARDHEDRIKELVGADPYGLGYQGGDMPGMYDHYEPGLHGMIGEGEYYELDW